MVDAKGTNSFEEGQLAEEACESEDGVGVTLAREGLQSQFRVLCRSCIVIHSMWVIYCGSFYVGHFIWVISCKSFYMDSFL